MGWRRNLLGRAEGRLLPMMYMIHRGFTLIELLVAMTIGVLLLMAMPQMALWMSGIDVRVSAQSLRVIVDTLSGGSTFYGVKLCDPAFPSTDPKGCP
jgi:prepilin-type N-terminal cleavage/methylation domain-containing protein